MRCGKCTKWCRRCKWPWLAQVHVHLPASDRRHQRLHLSRWRPCACLGKMARASHRRLGPLWEQTPGTRCLHGCTTTTDECAKDWARKVARRVTSGWAFVAATAAPAGRRWCCPSRRRKGPRRLGRVAQPTKGYAHLRRHQRVAVPNPTRRPHARNAANATCAKPGTTLDRPSCTRRTTKPVGCWRVRPRPWPGQENAGCRRVEPDATASCWTLRRQKSWRQ